MAHPYRIIVSGEGGQGALSIAKIMAYAAWMQGKHSLYVPYFSTEKRGGISMAYAQFGDENSTINLADDYAGIQWMRDNVQGTPTIIEAITPLYRWGGRYSINTGLPAVLGWPWHQQQQREKFKELLLDPRQADVDNFYMTADPKTAQDILKSVGHNLPVLGVPAGVKVYSSVFAINPRAAAETTLQFLNRTISTKPGEVLDIDEKEYRQNRLQVKLLGTLPTPDAGPLIQNPKEPSRSSEAVEMEEIADTFKEGDPEDGEDAEDDDGEGELADLDDDDPMLKD